MSYGHLHTKHKMDITLTDVLQCFFLSLIYCSCSTVVRFFFPSLSLTFLFYFLIQCYKRYLPFFWGPSFHRSKIFACACVCVRLDFMTNSSLCIKSLKYI